MSDENDDDSILGLFSTRATQGQTSSGTSTSLPSAARAAARRSSSTNLMSTRSSTGVSLGDEGGTSGGVSTATGTKGELSTTANSVLREARRELGSDFDLQRANDDGTQQIDEADIVSAVDKVLRRRSETLDDIERANVIIHLQKDIMGWGVLQPLIDNKEVTDIHVYDWRTVVLQRGKVSESTGLHFPNHQAYVSFIDRLLLRLGKSLSTQQHTVDAALGNGIRICAVHESVCGARGPLLAIRVPRIRDVSLDGLISYQVAPPLIVNYLASLTRSGMATIMVAGETGTGKTTLIKCLATQFGPDESIIAVEDTPELNFQHPYFRSLVSRPANVEGVGEVTLQEHIKTTLRMTPTRVILGEMRTPYAAEAFLESAQTGHVGMSTIHARNARETLVRLESLLGRAQKSVSIDIIRQQIALAIECVVWLFREKGSGKPRVGEIIEVGHFVEGVIQVRPMFTLVKTGKNPAWRVDSWTSTFDEILASDGIYLGDSPQELTLSNT
ncbi:Flp pilus assembly complex ATPase component TadA [bacterium]|nr:Flp pilus assembly complex ATPase component TadA [bacterium]